MQEEAVSKEFSLFFLLVKMGEESHIVKTLFSIVLVDCQ